MALVGCSEHANFKSLQAFDCPCPACRQNTEVFSDELDQGHSCAHCGAPLDLSRRRPAGLTNQD